MEVVPKIKGFQQAFQKKIRKSITNSLMMLMIIEDLISPLSHMTIMIIIILAWVMVDWDKML